MQEYNYCGFWRRFGALIIDGMLLFATSLILAIVGDLLYADDQLSIEEYARFIKLIPQISGVLIIALFNSSRLQATPGKYFLKMKIITTTGQRIVFLRALARVSIQSSVPILTLLFLDPLVYSIILYIQAIINVLSTSLIIFTKQKTALHDIICKTRVVACDKDGNIIKLKPLRALEGDNAYFS